MSEQRSVFVKSARSNFKEREAEIGNETSYFCLRITMQQLFLESLVRKDHMRQVFRDFLIRTNREKTRFSVSCHNQDDANLFSWFFDSK